MSKKYTYITISEEERLALETAVEILKAETSTVQPIVDSIKNLLERSKHKEETENE